MKKIFTLFFVFISFFSFGQNTFRTSIDGFNYNELNDLVQLNDGSFVGIGYAEKDSNDAYDSYTYIVKLTGQGQLVTTKAIKTSNGLNDVSGAALIKSSDGNLLVCGPENNNIGLTKFDANLNLLWHKEYATSGSYTYGTKLIQTNDDGYMIAGSFAKPESGNGSYQETGLIIKTDNEGNISWSKQYSDFSKNLFVNNNIIDIVNTKDGNYAVLANTISSASSFPDYDTTYLMKINGSGNILWSKYFVSDSSDLTSNSLLSASDGNLIIAGFVGRVYHFGSVLKQSPQTMLLKIDLAGNLLLSETNDTIANYVTYSHKVIEDKEGNYIMAGRMDSTMQNFNGRARSYILKIKSNGNLVWTKILSTPNISQDLFSIVSTNDGGYATCGNIYIDGNTGNSYDRGTIYKFDSNFNICGDVNSLGKLVNLNVNDRLKVPMIYDLEATTVSNSIDLLSNGTDICLCNNLLPVQLLSFNATLQNKTVSIAWKTTNEVNTDHFVVERSGDSRTFTSLQKITAKGNNAASVENYATVDLQPLQGTSYYRLKEVDKDGKITYSNIVSVTALANGTLVISPNPVHDNLHVLLQSRASGQAIFVVSDITGKIVTKQKNNIIEGMNTLHIPAASLSKGLYVLKVIQNNTVQSVKFIKQ